MIDSLRVYLKLVGASLRGQISFRGSFLLVGMGQFLMTATDFLGVWALFHHFGSIKGWKLPEIGLLYGILCFGFALAETAGRGFDTFSTLIKSGDFDRVLLRPRTCGLQLAGREFRLASQGRGLQGLAVLTWASLALGITWSPGRLLLLVEAILGTGCLFYGILILQATICFWTIETPEVVNIVTYGGIETAQYPLDIYAKPLRRFFTYVIPLAAVSYGPALGILGRSSGNWLPVLSPLIGLLFLILAFCAWSLGVRHYQSTGN